MKGLVQFIYEELMNKELQDLLVCYSMKNGENIIVQAPDTFSEDDLIQYLSDRLFEEYPAGKNTAEDFFGANAEKIIDVYFEYKSFKKETNEEHGDFDLAWDNKYSSKNFEEDDLTTFILEEVTYNIHFESFSMKTESDTDIDKDLYKIFEVTESNKTNEYPIELKLADKKPFDYKAKI